VKKVLTCFAVAMLFVLTNCSQEPNDVVARVEGQTITSSELTYWMLLEKANTFNYFYQKYKVVDSKSFWTQKFGNETPLARLRRVALNKAVRCKIQQILALDKGIIESANFNKIMQELDGVNAERKSAVSNQEPVYGLVRFTKRTYFSHVLDKMIVQLKNKLAENELKPDAKTMRELKSKHPHPSENLSGFITMQYVDQVYEQYVDAMARKAKVEINSGVFTRVSL